MKALTFYARRVKQGSVTFYETSIEAGNLTDKDYYAADGWNYATGTGYQREQNPSHVRSITTYLGKGDGHSNVIPANIVLNSRLPLRVKELGNDLVEITVENWPLYIIDGQHRIQATDKAIEEGTDLGGYEFPVTITNFTLEEEMVQFKNLNFTATRPPKGLGQTITAALATDHGWAPRNWSEQATTRAVAITMRLANDTASPWYGKIALGGVRKRAYHTTVQANFVASLEKLFIDGRFADPNERIDHVYELINNFWIAVDHVWPAAMSTPELSLIQRHAGFKPLNQIMGKIYGTINNNASLEEVENYLQEIRENLNVDDIAWGASTGLVKALRSGYSEHKATGAVTEYLWNGIHRS